jgi:FKBP-type peptidyl-prolyl cis-trans isomerase
MKKLTVYLLSLFAVSLLVLGCNSDISTQKQPGIADQDKSLEKVNRYLVKTEKQDIENYINRHGWTMEETGSGLRYEIYQSTDGEPAAEGKIALMAYKTWLINGDLVYNSHTDGNKEFLIGKGGVESGLEEGILKMKVGEKARFILPSHLAFGLMGDDNKIPARTAIVYELELINLK